MEGPDHQGAQGGLFIPPAVGIETVAMPGAQGGANWGTTAAHPTNGSVYVLSINVPSIYKLDLVAPGQGGGGDEVAVPAPAVMAQGRGIYEQRCQACHGADLAGIGNFPSLQDIAKRMPDKLLRAVITGGRLAMPPNPMPAAELDALLAFLANPAATPGGRRRPRRGRGSRGRRSRGPGRRAGRCPRRGRCGPWRWRRRMAGPDYPAGLDAPKVRYYTDYGMQNTLVQPPYSTLTAYDLNTGTIKWQIPAGGDEPRAIAEGGSNTGFPMARTGIITTASGLLFHAGLDSKLRAYDAETGKVLWTGDLPAGSRGIPAMYEVNGKQYLLVSATQGGGRGGPGPANPNAPGAAGAAPAPPRAYVAFALP